MTINHKTITSLFVVLGFASSLVLLGCPEEGDDGEGGVDCGDYGSEHDGHCHCDEGYLFDGETCVSPDEITEVCEEHDEDAGAEEEEEEHEHHEACICPEQGECHCEGEIVTIGGQDYCEPELH